MADIIDEVIRDSREEKKIAYFKKSLPIILIATIVIIFGMIVNDFRKNNAQEHNQEIGDIILNSLENLSKDPDVTMEGLKYVQDNAKNHAKDLAILQQVAINIASDKKDEALALLNIAISDKKLLDLTRSYAKLTWISIIMDKKSISDEEKNIMEKYFKDFTEKTPFFASSKLLEALYYSSSDKEKAASIAQSLISSKLVTVNVKEEAAALISNLKIGK